MVRNASVIKSNQHLGSRQWAGFHLRFTVGCLR